MFFIKKIIKTIILYIAKVINIYPENVKYKKFRNFYLFYLTIYFLILIAYLIFDVNRL